MNTTTAKPLAGLFAVVFALLAMATLWAASIPYWDGLSLFGFVLFGWIPLLLVYLVWLTLTAHRSRSPFLLAAPFAITIAVMVALGTDVSFQARFALSHAAMDRLVTTIDPEADHACHDAGLYRLCQEPLYVDGDDTPDGVAFAIDNGSDGVRGFAHSPGGAPPSSGDDEYDHLTGDWYRWKGWDGW